jgi:lipoprotein NlpD
MRIRLNVPDQLKSNRGQKKGTKVTGLSNETSKVQTNVVEEVKKDTLDRKDRISNWLWPTKGEIIRHFTGKNANNGMDISGQKGSPIGATADGVVVYAGSGLRGYGHLLIIQHNDVFLSAYGHNRSLLVVEGETVKAGQTIAEMGDTDAESPRLHFQIRRDGKPVNPLDYLPD